MDQYQRPLDEWRARAKVSVAVGAVRRDGSLAWRGASIADRGDVASPRSQFPIYSITKTLTAACLLRLDQSGVLRMDDPISRWISDLPVPQAITLSQLLRHTSGIPDYGPLREYHEAVRTTPSAPWTDDQFVSATLRKGLLFEPGAGWAYSNVGYLLLRRAIENATARRYRQCIADQVASPLGLAHTFVAETIQDWKCCVPGYGGEVRADGEVTDIRSSYHPGWCGPGVAVSTVDDVTLFYDALFSGVLLDQQHLDQMLQLTRVPGSHPPAVTPSYGMGIMADPDGPFGPSYGHGGGGPGYSLCAAILPRSPQGRLSVAVFCNNSLGADAGQGVDGLFQAAARVRG
jgi:D-alanyl-D-alanine carboxypeptidase